MPGKLLLVTIIAHTARHPKMEGNGEEEVIVVDKFLSIKQQERCTGSVPPSSLGNTYWKLVELEGQRLDEMTPGWMQFVIVQVKAQAAKGIFILSKISEQTGAKYPVSLGKSINKGVEQCKI